MNIRELDKNKTEQAISNEHARLDTCRESLERLVREYDTKKFHYTNDLNNLENKIKTLKESIESGEIFIRQCNEHLILDFNN